MKKLYIFSFFLLCFSFLTLNQPTAVKSQQVNCANIIGSWQLNDKSTLKIRNTSNCKISGSFIGKKSTVNFNGTWDNNEKVYGYSGEGRGFDYKCQLRIGGKLKLEGNTLKTTVKNYSFNCPFPEELRRELVFSRKN